MTDTTADRDDELDQDSEPTMMAPPEGRPDGTADAGGTNEEGVHAQDADDQSGAESPSA